MERKLLNNSDSTKPKSPTINLSVEERAGLLTKMNELIANFRSKYGGGKKRWPQEAFDLLADWKILTREQAAVRRQEKTRKQIMKGGV